MFRIRNMMPRLPSDIENANVPMAKKNINPLIINGASLKVFMGFLLKTTILKTSKMRFSNAASKAGKLLMSMNVGL